jgi:hypothetical protein
MLGLWLGTSSPNAMRLQVAFRMRPNAVLASAEVLQTAGLQPLDFHAQPTQEPSVIMDASVLFDDQDGHLLVTWPRFRMRQGQTLALSRTPSELKFGPDQAG